MPSSDGREERSSRSVRRRFGAAAAGAVLALLIVASAAFAYTDHWFSGTLQYGRGYASVAAHSITYIEGDANNSGFCIAGEQGISGYHDAGDVPCQVAAGSNGVAAAYYAGVCCYHADISNYNGFNIEVYTSTHYDY